MRKAHAAAQGIVATDNLSTIYQREIFFQVDPATLDTWNWEDLHDLMPSGLHIEFDPHAYLKYLPDLEQEIFFLAFTKKKNQKDIAKLLGLGQPTVSYRYRRTIQKLAYLMALTAVDFKALINELDFLKDHEKEVLIDLLLYTNQEMVAKKYGIRQSSVKWVFVKAKRRLEDAERNDPDKWFHHLGVLILLEVNLVIRVLH